MPVDRRVIEKHSVFSGPFPSDLTSQRVKYRVTYVCLVSGHEFTYAVRSKNGTADTLDMLAVEYPHPILQIRLDGGGEFLGVFKSTPRWAHNQFDIRIRYERE